MQERAIILKRDARGRVRTPVEQRAAVVAEFERSGLPGTQFAMPTGLMLIRSFLPHPFGAARASLSISAALRFRMTWHTTPPTRPPFEAPHRSGTSEPGSWRAEVYRTWPGGTGAWAQVEVSAQAAGYQEPETLSNVSTGARIQHSGAAPVTRWIGCWQSSCQWSEVDQALEAEWSR